MRRLLFFVLFILLAPQVKAQTALLRNAQTKILCFSHSQKCKDGALSSLPEPLKLAIASCETVAKSPYCQELVQKEPEFLGHLRRCEPAQFCEDHLFQEIDSLAYCKQGFLEGTGEIFHDVIETFKNGWDNIQARNRFLRECVSLECKRNLIKEVSKFQALSDAELNNYSAAALDVEKNNYIYNHSTLKRHAHQNKTPAERAETFERPVRSQTSDDGKSFFYAVMDWLKKKEARLECLDAKTRAEMVCWGAAYILDPLMIGGAVTKSSAIARYLSVKARSERALRVDKLEVAAEKMDAELRSQIRPAGVSYKNLQEKLHPVWQSKEIPIEEKFRTSYEQYVKLRMDSLTPEQRKLADEALKNIVTLKNSPEAFYYPDSNRIMIGDKLADDLLTCYQTLVHELEHVTQKGTIKNSTVTEELKNKISQFVNSSPKPQQKNTTVIKAEFEAIGAQWDFLQSVPKEVINQSIANVKNNRHFSPELKRSLLADLNNASLSREEYLKIVPKAHTYSTLYKLESDQVVRRAILGGVVLGGAALLESR